VSIPNIITLARLLSVPVIIWLVLADSLRPALALFALAGVSDAVDGFIARQFDQRSALGALLDPIADKVMLVSLFVTLGVARHLPSWLVTLVVFRDAMIVGGFLLWTALGLRFRWEPLMIGKVNTVAQICLVGVTLGRLAFGVDDYRLGEALIYLVGATTLLSGGAYLVRWARTLTGAEINP
jgi:cardiolipin synthase (CMP-forming)